MNPPAPARIALAALLILATSSAFGGIKKCPSIFDGIKLALENKKPNLPDILAKLDALKPTTPDETEQLRALKATVNYRQGEAWHLAGKYNAAIASLRNAATLSDLTSRPDDWGKIHHLLAWVLHEHRDFAEARLIAENVLAHRDRTLGPDHPDTLSSANNLAGMYSEKGDYNTAVALFRRALEGRERTLGPENSITAFTAYNLALCYKQQNDIPKALPLAERAYKGLSKAYGEMHSKSLLARQLLDELKQK